MIDVGVYRLRKNGDKDPRGKIRRKRTPEFYLNIGGTSREVPGLRVLTHGGEGDTRISP